MAVGFMGVPEPSPFSAECSGDDESGMDDGEGDFEGCDKSLLELFISLDLRSEFLLLFASFFAIIRCCASN